MRRRKHRRVGGRKLNKRQRKEVKQLIIKPMELKYGITNQATRVVGTTALIDYITAVSQGSGDNQRIGDTLNWCGKMEMAVQFHNGAGANSGPWTTFRFIMFQWHPNSTPVAANILLNGANGAIGVTSRYNHDLRQEYKIILDKVIHLVGNGSSATQPYAPNVQRLKVYKISTKKITKRAQFSGGTTAGTNGIYCLYITDSGAATLPTIEYSFKMFWRDA